MCQTFMDLFHIGIQGCHCHRSVYDQSFLQYFSGYLYFILGRSGVWLLGHLSCG